MSFPMTINPLASDEAKTDCLLNFLIPSDTNFPCLHCIWLLLLQAASLGLASPNLLQWADRFSSMFCLSSHAGGSSAQGPLWRGLVASQLRDIWQLMAIHTLEADTTR